MPVLLESIDAIARRLKRDVVWVRFYNPTLMASEVEPSAISALAGADDVNIAWQESLGEDWWEKLPARRKVIRWLRAHTINFVECFDIWSPGLLLAPYQGSLFIDVPFDEGSSRYQAVREFLEKRGRVSAHAGSVLVGAELPDSQRHVLPNLQVPAALEPYA